MGNVKSLPEAVLGIISGGQLLEGKTENIAHVAHVLRDQSGMSLEEAKHLFIMDYHRVPHLYSTTGSEETFRNIWQDWKKPGTANKPQYRSAESLITDERFY